MENPFPSFKAAEKPKAELKDRIKTAQITVEDNDKAYALRFDLPPDADWRTVVAYQCALWRQLGDEFDYPLLSRRDDKTYIFGDIRKREFQKDEVTAWPEKIQEDLFSEESLERAEEDCREIEERLAEDASYEARKKELLTNLLKTLERPDGEIKPLPIEFSKGVIRYRILPNELMGQTIEDVFQDMLGETIITHHHIIEPDVYGKLLGPLFRLQEHCFELEGDSNMTKEAKAQAFESIKARVADAFKQLLKSGPGRNKIKYELKKMSPDYKPRDK